MISHDLSIWMVGKDFPLDAAWVVWIKVESLVERVFKKDWIGVYNIA